MSARPPSAAAPRADRGFVLVGVVVFVLALTIIGISLYSISGYEAGFFQQSLWREQAFQSAMGGIERAKFMLETTSSLASVKQNLPLEDVTLATAIQVKSGTPDSVGTVAWTGSPPPPITLRVLAVVPAAQSGVRSESRMVEATFNPRAPLNFYQQVITTGGTIEIVSFEGTPPTDDRRYTVQLDGPVWDSAPDDTMAWLSLLAPAGSVQHPILRPGCPTPSADAFIAAKSPAAAPVELPANPPSQTTYDYDVTVNGGPTAIGYFYGSVNNGTLDYSLWHTSAMAPPRILVRRTAVWLLPRGARFEQTVSVEKQSPGVGGCLVMVAGASTDPGVSPPIGIWFRGGLQVASGISVILVSSAQVNLEHLNAYNTPSYAPDIALFASSVKLAGPTTSSGVGMTLQHAPGGPIDVLYLPNLVSAGALPDITRNHDLTAAASSWRIYTP